MTVGDTDRQPRGRWRRRSLARRLRRNRLPYTAWRLYVRDLSILHGLSRRQRCRLRQLVGLFLRDKRLSSTGGLIVDDRMRLLLASAACLPILELGLEHYRHWRELILYPDSFLVEREEIDEAGVLHQSTQTLAGESADQGAMVLSWGDVSRDAAQQGLDLALVIHECAHKLDALSGVSDGCPPLHGDMSAASWQRDFSDAFERLRRAREAGVEPVLDSYGAESPAEFFAVCSEQFFCDPTALLDAEPAIFRQLRSFYRQDPAQRSRGAGA